MSPHVPHPPSTHFACFMWAVTFTLEWNTPFQNPRSATVSATHFLLSWLLMLVTRLAEYQCGTSMITRCIKWSTNTSGALVFQIVHMPSEHHGGVENSLGIGQFWLNGWGDMPHRPASNCLLQVPWKVDSSGLQTTGSWTGIKGQICKLAGRFKRECILCYESIIETRWLCLHISLV